MATPPRPVEHAAGTPPEPGFVGSKVAPAPLRDAVAADRPASASCALRPVEGAPVVRVRGRVHGVRERPVGRGVKVARPARAHRDVVVARAEIHEPVLEEALLDDRVGGAWLVLALGLWWFFQRV